MDKMEFVAMFFGVLLPIFIVIFLMVSPDYAEPNTTVIYKSDRLACDGRGE